jgi:hypothetical protein
MMFGGDFEQGEGAAAEVQSSAGANLGGTTTRGREGTGPPGRQQRQRAAAGAAEAGVHGGGAACGGAAAAAAGQPAGESPYQPPPGVHIYIYSCYLR